MRVKEGKKLSSNFNLIPFKINRILKSLDIMNLIAFSISTKNNVKKTKEVQKIIHKYNLFDICLMRSPSK
jgi:hypothetical protein